LPWYLDFTAWTAALAVVGFPFAALAASYFGALDARYSIVFRGLVIILSGLVFIVNAMRYGIRLPDPFLLVFLAVYSVRLIWDTGRPIYPDADYALTYYAAAVIAPLVGVLLPARSWKGRNFLACFYCVGAAGCILSLILALQGYSTDADATTRLEFERLSPISVGHLATTTILATIAAWTVWPSRTLRVVALGALGFAVPLLYLTLSRGPLVSLLVPLSIYIVRRRMWYLVLPMVAGLLFVFFNAPLVEGESLLDHMRITGVDSGETVSIRFELYQLAWDEFVANPILGSGYAVPITGEYPHNMILESGMALGVAGFVLLISLLVRTIPKAISAMSGDDAIFALMFLQYAMGAQFSGGIWDAVAVYMFMDVLLSRAPPKSPAPA